MGKLKWYRRDPNAALTGMHELTLEERGAYNTVLDLMYARDGDLQDDDKFIAGWLRVDVRVWKRIRARLLELGKLCLDINGRLYNRRVDEEVLRALGRSYAAQQAGRSKGHTQPPNPPPKPNGFNGMHPTDARPSDAASAAASDELTRTQNKIRKKDSLTVVESAPLARAREEPPAAANDDDGGGAQAAGRDREELTRKLAGLYGMKGERRPSAARGDVDAWVTAIGWPRTKKILNWAFGMENVGDYGKYIDAAVGKEGHKAEAAKFAATQPVVDPNIEACKRGLMRAQRSSGMEAHDAYVDPADYFLAHQAPGRA